MKVVLFNRVFRMSFVLLSFVFRLDNSIFVFVILICVFINGGVMVGVGMICIIEKMKLRFFFFINWVCFIYIVDRVLY